MYDAALIVCIFVAALLYSSVGHAGASGYLAAMALFGVAPESMRPAALILNILVASIGTIRFYRAGCFSWSLFWPFALGAIPFAFLGGSLTLPSHVYKQVVGVVLWFVVSISAVGSDCNYPMAESDVPAFWTSHPIHRHDAGCRGAGADRVAAVAP